VIGALTGGTSGATGAALGTVSAPVVADALTQAGIEGQLADSLITLASSAAGAVVGGAYGGAAAYNEVLNNYLTTQAINRTLERLADEDSEQNRRLKVVLLEAQQQNAPVDQCRVIGSDCSYELETISAGLHLLLDPGTREFIGDDLITDAFIARQIADMHQVLQAIDWSEDPDNIARKEAATKAARNLVDACAVVPVAVHCRVVSLAITGGEAVEKVSDGDLMGAGVQVGAVIANYGVGTLASGTVQKTGAYSKEFLEWMNSIYGAATEQIIQGVYDEMQSATDTGGE
jgi:hypothetical protein